MAVVEKKNGTHFMDVVRFATVRWGKTGPHMKVQLCLCTGIFSTND